MCLVTNMVAILALFEHAHLAQTPEKFEDIWRSIVAHDEIKDYMALWYACKTQWARAWTSKMKNYGIVSTQRAEGGNARLKQFVKQGCVLMCFDCKLVFLHKQTFAIENVQGSHSSSCSKVWRTSLRRTWVPTTSIYFD